MKKIGIFGGSFNPPHIGHLKCLQHVLKESFLENILIVPASNPPHKTQQTLIAVEDRLNMVKLTFSNITNFSISEIEITQQRTNYTIDTLNFLKKQMPDDSFYFILGADNLQTIHTWKEHQNLIQNNNFILMNRPLFELKNDCCPDLTKNEFNKLTENICLTPLIDISSTKIRNNFYKNPEIIQPYLKNSVYDYIKKHNLYKNIRK